MITAENTLLLVATAAVLSHKLYWCRYEFDEKVPKILLVAILSFTAITFTVSRSHSIAFGSYIAFRYLAVYTISLFSSIVIYRAYFHPLKKFPGPFWARIFSWWRVKHIAQDGPYYAFVDRLHAKYGDVVRIGKYTLHRESSQLISQVRTIYRYATLRACKSSMAASHYVRNRRPI